MAEAEEYLHECFLLFPKMTQALFGRSQDLMTIERELGYVIKNNCFDSADLLRIIDAKEWDYKKFWPEIGSFAGNFTPIKGCFRLGWEGRKEVVEALYKEFKHIEVVSVILRFIDPDNFGIISPPVEKMLGLQPEDDHIKYYLSYLEILKKIVGNYDKPGKIAHMDMAVWCLFFIIKNKSNRAFWSNWAAEDRRMKEHIYLAYMRDTFFKREKLVRALRQVYECIEGGNLNSRRLILAECLNDEGTDPALAMVTASYAFESFVWDLFKESPRLRDKISCEDKDISLGKLIYALEGRKIRKTLSDFRECVDRRNRSVHPWRTPLSPDERKGYITKVNSLLRLRTKKAL